MPRFTGKDRLQEVNEIAQGHRSSPDLHPSSLLLEHMPLRTFDFSNRIIIRNKFNVQKLRLK